MSNNLLAVLVLVAVVAIIFVLLRRKPSNAGSTKTTGRVQAPTRENMLQIVLSPDNACKAAQELASHRFYKDNAPQLPLSNCQNRNSCHCRFQMVMDRRVAERRLVGHEKRETIRFEENPRRKGRGRREQDSLFDHKD